MLYFTDKCPRNIFRNKITMSTHGLVPQNFSLTIYSPHLLFAGKTHTCLHLIIRGVLWPMASFVVRFCHLLCDVIAGADFRQRTVADLLPVLHVLPSRGPRANRRAVGARCVLLRRTHATQVRHPQLERRKRLVDMSAYTSMQLCGYHR